MPLLWTSMQAFTYISIKQKNKKIYLFNFFVECCWYPSTCRTNIRASVALPLYLFIKRIKKKKYTNINFYVETTNIGMP